MQRINSVPDNTSTTTIYMSSSQSEKSITIYMLSSQSEKSRRWELMFPILRNPPTSNLTVFIQNSNGQEVYIRKGSTFIWKKIIVHMLEILVCQKNGLYHIHINTGTWQKEYCNSLKNSRLQDGVLLQENIPPPDGKRFPGNLDTLSSPTLMILLQNLVYSFASRRPYMVLCYFIFISLKKIPRTNMLIPKILCYRSQTRNVSLFFLYPFSCLLP